MRKQLKLVWTSCCWYKFTGVGTVAAARLGTAPHAMENVPASKLRKDIKEKTQATSVPPSKNALSTLSTLSTHEPRDFADAFASGFASSGAAAAGEVRGTSWIGAASGADAGGGGADAGGGGAGAGGATGAAVDSIEDTACPGSGCHSPGKSGCLAKTSGACAGLQPWGSSAALVFRLSSFQVVNACLFLSNLRIRFQMQLVYMGHQ